MAREKALRDLLLGRENLTHLPGIADDLGGLDRKLLLLLLHTKEGIDHLEQYAITNMMAELLPEGGLLGDTSVSQDVCLLVDAGLYDQLPPAVERLCDEFARFRAGLLTVTGMGGGRRGRRAAADIAHRPHTDIALHSGGNLLHPHRNQNITAGKAERRVTVRIAQRVVVHQVGGGVLLGVQAFQQGQRIFRCGGLQAACLLVGAEQLQIQLLVIRRGKHPLPCLVGDSLPRAEAKNQRRNQIL